MNCQDLFSGKKEEKYFKVLSAASLALIQSLILDLNTAPDTAIIVMIIYYGKCPKILNRFHTFSLPKLFSSPAPSAKVSYCDHPLSVVCVSCVINIYLVNTLEATVLLQIFMKQYQNVCHDNILVKFEYGPYRVKN